MGFLQPLTDILVNGRFTGIRIPCVQGLRPDRTCLFFAADSRRPKILVATDGLAVGKNWHITGFRQRYRTQQKSGRAALPSLCSRRAVPDIYTVAGTDPMLNGRLRDAEKAREFPCHCLQRRVFRFTWVRTVDKLQLRLFAKQALDPSQYDLLCLSRNKFCHFLPILICNRLQLGRQLHIGKGRYEQTGFFANIHSFPAEQTLARNQHRTEHGPVKIQCDISGHTGTVLHYSKVLHKTLLFGLSPADISHLFGHPLVCP